MVEEKGGKAEVADARGDTGDALCSSTGDIFTQKTKYTHVKNATKVPHKLLVKKGSNLQHKTSIDRPYIYV